jgi:CBS domain-containing protein
VDPENSLLDTVKAMNEHGAEGDIINQLIVMEDKQIKGIISDGDIIRAIKV